MKYKLFRQMLTGLMALTLGTTAPTEPGAAQSNNKFYSGWTEGALATIVRTNKRNVPIIHNSLGRPSFRGFGMVSSAPLSGSLWHSDLI